MKLRYGHLKKLPVKILSYVAAAVTGGIGTLLIVKSKVKTHLDGIIDNGVLELEKRRPEYIYVDDLRFNEAWNGRRGEDWEGWTEARGENFSMESWGGGWIYWWKWRLSLLPLRLLEIAATSDNPSHRTMATMDLSKCKDLKDYQYQMLAQASLPSTVVAMARSRNVDSRFFLKPHRLQMQSATKWELLEGLRNVFSRLNKEKDHICLRNFFTRSFPKIMPLDRDLPAGMELSTCGGSETSEENIFIPCIEALLHHSSYQDNAKDLVESGALPLLFQVRENLSKCKKGEILLGTLLKKTSLFPEHLKDLFLTGWLSVIASWASDPDPHLSVPASTTLANLDSYSSVRYGSSLSLLYPNFSPSSRLKADVVLIHGLLGGVHYTWKSRNSKEPITLFGITSSGDTLGQICSRIETVSEGNAGVIDDLEEGLESDFEFVLSDIPLAVRPENAKGPYSFNGANLQMLKWGQETEVRVGCFCWPREWLPKDCGGQLRIIGVSYDSRLSDWLSWCPLNGNGTLENTSKDLLDQLLKCGIGKRPIIWIAHSKGGLLVKEMLVQAWEKKEGPLSEIYLNSKAIVFLSTPHLGSPLASLSEASRLVLLPSTEIRELSANSPTLTTLHQKFLKMIKDHPMEIVTFVETENMKVTPLELKIHCVPPNFGDSGVGTIYEIPLGHMDICKPENRLSFIYQKILSVVESVLNKNNTRKIF